MASAAAMSEPQVISIGSRWVASGFFANACLLRLKVAIEVEIDRVLKKIEVHHQILIDSLHVAAAESRSHFRSSALEALKMVSILRQTWRPYEHFARCVAARMLQNLKLRKAAGPFDWLLDVLWPRCLN